MLSLKCTVDFSVVELKLIMKMVIPIPRLLKKQATIHTVCSGYYRRQGEEGLVIVLCMFGFYNSILNLDIKNTVGN